MSDGARPRGRRLEDLAPEGRAKVEAIRARWRTPEARAEEEHVRDVVMEEFPPKPPEPELLEALVALRLGRDRLGLSLAGVASRSGLERSMLSRLETGKLRNPTVDTLRRYAAPLGMRLAWTLAPADVPVD